MKETIKKEQTARQHVKMGILKRSGLSVEEIEKQEAQRFENYQKIIDFFISKGAQIDKPNNFNARWTDIPGLDEGFARYAREAIKKRNK